MASEAVNHISDANSNFSNKLYDILARKGEDVFYSPISAHAILSLVYQGSDGSTAEAFQKALHLSDKKIAAEGYLNLMEKLNSVTDVKLHIANKVFVKQDCALKKEFNEIARKHFLSETENVNFSENHKAAKIINDWVENKTNNKITDLIAPDDLDDLTRLVLVNAIYFKGDWLHKFQPSLTMKEKFYLSESETVDCDMMHMNRKFRYGEDYDLDAQILSLPYKNENLSLIVILPRSKTGISDLEKKIQTKSLTKINQSLRSVDIILSLPKFKIETTMDLKDPLSELGLEVMFSNNASFPHMLDGSEQLKVSKVIQKAFIEVNEEGAEAAAATGVAMMVRCMPMPAQKFVFEANRPFIFALFYQSEQSFPLFVGKFMNSK